MNNQLLNLLNKNIEKHSSYKDLDDLLKGVVKDEMKKVIPLIKHSLIGIDIEKGDILSCYNLYEAEVIDDGELKLKAHVKYLHNDCTDYLDLLTNKDWKKI